MTVKKLDTVILFMEVTEIKFESVKRSELPLKSQIWIAYWQLEKDKVQCELAKDLNLI